MAGSGMDASPYFRVFNALLQSENLDKEGEYIKKWCPELASLTNKTVHNPSEVDSKILKTAGITLGKEYPKILIDHTKARDRAMLEWRRIHPRAE